MTAALAEAATGAKAPLAAADGPARVSLAVRPQPVVHTAYAVRNGEWAKVLIVQQGRSIEAVIAGDNLNDLLVDL